MRKRIEVPKEPGTEPIPSNHLRLYHYTRADPEVIRKEGLKRSHSEGSKCGEYDVVWASLTMPPSYKNYVEFSMAIDDPRFAKWAGAAPDPTQGVEFYKNRGNDFTIYGDIEPSEFIAVHEPWHHSYRDMVEDGLTDEVLQGEYDDLTPDKHPGEYKAIQAIKYNFGGVK